MGYMRHHAIIVTDWRKECKGYEDDDGHWYCPGWDDWFEGTYRCSICTPIYRPPSRISVLAAAVWWAIRRLRG